MRINTGPGDCRPGSNDCCSYQQISTTSIYRDDGVSAQIRLGNRLKMRRKILGYNGLTDFFRHQKMPGIVELQMGKGFTPEEEDRLPITTSNVYRA
jgi:hypothetical protein